jgi:hypothetical protein
MTNFYAKVKRHLPWEFFWKYLSWIAFSILIILAGIRNDSGDAMFQQLGIIILGIVMLVFSIWRTFYFYKKL